MNWLYRLYYGPIFRFKKHWFDIRFYSLKQYNDFSESRLCKFLMWIGLYNDSFYSPIGIELWLSSFKDFDDKELDRFGSSNLKVLAAKCKIHLFQKAKGYGLKTGKLLGIMVTHEDFYYILMDEYGNKWYETCCSKLEFIKE